MDENPVVAQPPVVDGEITLEQFNADEAPVEKSKETKQEAKAESTPEPVAPAVPVAPEAETKEDKEKTDDTAVPEPPDVPKKSDEVPEEKSEEKPEEAKPQETKAEARKTQLNTEIRDLVAERNRLKAEVEKQNAEVYQVATEDELVEQGMTAVEAKVEALRQEHEMDKYNSQVADAQLTLGHESNRVLNEFGWANPDSESFNKQLAERAAALLEKNLIRDPNSQQVIGSNVSLYELYQTIDDATKISETQGQLKGQEDTEKMLANADTASVVSPPKEKVDPLLELWRSDDI